LSESCLFICNFRFGLYSDPLQYDPKKPQEMPETSLRSKMYVASLLWRNYREFGPHARSATAKSVSITVQ